MGLMLVSAVRLFCDLLIVLIFVRAILSWFPQPRDDGLFKQLYFGVLRLAHTLTDPIVSPIRNLIQKSPLGGPGMVLDFSPLIAIILINIARSLLIQLILSVFGGSGFGF